MQPGRGWVRARVRVRVSTQHYVYPKTSPVHNPRPYRRGPSAKRAGERGRVGVEVGNGVGVETGDGFCADVYGLSEQDI